MEAPTTPETIKTYWTLKVVSDRPDTVQYVVVEGNSFASMRSASLPVVPCSFGSYKRFFEYVTTNTGVQVDLARGEITVSQQNRIGELLNEYMVSAASNAKPAKVRCPPRVAPAMPFCWDDQGVQSARQRLDFET